MMFLGESYAWYTVVLIIFVSILYYIAYKISNMMSFAPTKITDIDMQDLKAKFGDNIKIGQFSNGNVTLWYALFNRYRRPSWNDNITFYCHGNGGWLGGDVNGSYFAELSRHGSVFVVDYRGYGLSSGSPTENGLYSDAYAAWRFVTEKKGIDVDKTVVFGHSMGTSVVSHMLRRTKRDGGRLPRHLVLSAPFYNFRTISIDHYPGIGKFNVNRFSTDKYLREIRDDVKIMYVHSEHDSLINIYHSYKLRDENPGNLHIIEGTHNAPVLTDGAKDELTQIFKDINA